MKSFALKICCLEVDDVATGRWTISSWDSCGTNSVQLRPGFQAVRIRPFWTKVNRPAVGFRLSSGRPWEGPSVLVRELCCLSCINEMATKTVNRWSRFDSLIGLVADFVWLPFTLFWFDWTKTTKNVKTIRENLIWFCSRLNQN